MRQDEMKYFTHVVEGEVYGAWYQQLSPHDLEVIGAGFMRRVPYAGFDELAVARSILEELVLSQKHTDAPLHALGSSDQLSSSPP